MHPPVATLPADHPRRLELSNEVHARPPLRLATPCRISFFALLQDDAERERESACLADLGERFGVEFTPAGRGHAIVDLGPVVLKWERHTEFSTYTWILPGAGEAQAVDALPAEWLRTLPGRTMVASHVTLRRALAGEPDSVPADGGFAGDSVNGSAIADAGGWIFTDFAIGADGFSRFLVLDASLTPRQAGRMVQRLLEIETYRVMALLAFPLAREVGAALARWEHTLAEVTQRMAASTQDDTPLLADLARLAAEVEQSVARSTFRFGAADAYYRLVQRRVTELRERRVPGLQTFEEFVDRRLAPALTTCATISRRQEDLSARVSRTSQLLRTRVDIALERQNQELLTQMNRRARLQLRLQETVEGLSIAAISYYVVGLLGYALKGLKGAGVPLDADLATGVAIPLVVAGVWLAVRRVRRGLREDG
jgi:uncharacterized membrane-anchored protein